MRGIGNRLMRVVGWCQDRLFAIVGLVVGVYCLTSVSQVSHLIGQWPTDWGHRIGFGILLGLLFLFYATTLLDLWQPLHSIPVVWNAGNRFLKDFPALRKVVTRSARLISGVNGIVVTVATKMKPMSEGRKGYLLPALMVIAGGIAALWIPIGIHRPYRLFGSILQSAALWIGFVGAFLLYGKLIGPDQVIRWARESKSGKPAATDSGGKGVERGTSRLDRSEKEARSGWDFSGAVLSWLLVTAVIGELLWIAAEFDVPGFSHRLYTIWALIHVAVALVVIGALIDFFQRNSEIPARLIAFIVLAVFVWFQGGEQIKDDPTTLLAAPVQASSNGEGSSSTNVSSVWIEHMTARLDSMKSGPVVLIAASGGGSRAALFTSLVLRLLEEEKLEFPAVDSLFPTIDSQDSAAARWADNILMVSGVSGGSLATARYLNNGNTKATVDTLVYTGEQELLGRTVATLSDWIGKSDTSRADEQARLRRIRDAVDEFRRSGPTGETVTNNATAETGEGDDHKWISDIINIIFESRFVDEMCADFMAPVLRGFLTPFSTRGQGLYHFWEQQFGWQGVRLNDPMTESSMRGRPLALFNVADADTGRRIVLGCPPLPVGLLDSFQQSSVSTEREVDLFREREYEPVAGTEAGLIGVTLTRAVRLSANFPFGFQIADLRRMDPPPRSSPDLWRTPTIRLLDGGVVDNTGIDSLLAVFESLHRRALRNPTGEEAHLLQKIRSRGVVLVEIDSGAKPTESSGENTPFAVITDPLSALNNATYTNSLRSGDTQIRRIREILSHWLPGGMIRDPQRDTIPLSVGDIELNVTSEQLESAIPALMAANPEALNRTAVVPVRFVCNHTSRSDSYVMTAFALGPQDKAVVVAQFLDQALLWRTANHSRKTEFSNSRTAAQKATKENVREEVVQQLVNAAQRQTTLALNSLRKKGDGNGERADEIDPNLSDDDIRAALLRPYILLMGIRVLASDSSELIANAEPLTKLESEFLAMARPLWESTTDAAVADESDPDANETISINIEQVQQQFQTSLKAYSTAASDSLNDIARDIVRENEESQRRVDVRQQQTREYFKKMAAE